MTLPKMIKVILITIVVAKMSLSMSTMGKKRIMRVGAGAAVLAGPIATVSGQRSSLGGAQSALELRSSVRPPASLAAEGHTTCAPRPASFNLNPSPLPLMLEEKARVEVGG